MKWKGAGGGWLRTAGFLVMGGLLLSGCGSDEPGSHTNYSWFLLAGMLLSTLAVGALPICFRINRNRKVLESMTCISAGLLLAAAFTIAIPEGFDVLMDAETHETHGIDEGHEEAGSALWYGLAILAGFLLLFLAESLGFGHDIHEEHHGQGHVHHPEMAPGRQMILILVTGLTIHSLADGMALGAGLAAESDRLATTLFASILTHKLPAAFGLVVFSQHAYGNGWPTWRNLVVFSLATPLAILVTWQVLDHLADRYLALVLLFSAGTFIYVATIDVLPGVLRTRGRKRAALLVVLGCLLLISLNFLLGYAGLSPHDHGTGSH